MELILLFNIKKMLQSLKIYNILKYLKILNIKNFF